MWFSTGYYSMPRLEHRAPPAVRLSPPILPLGSPVKSSRCLMHWRCCPPSQVKIVRAAWIHIADQFLQSTQDTKKTQVLKCVMLKSAMDSMCHFKDCNKHTTLQRRRAFLKWKFGAGLSDERLGNESEQEPSVLWDVKPSVIHAKAHLDKPLYSSLLLHIFNTCHVTL